MTHTEIDTTTQQEDLYGGQIYYVDTDSGVERSALLTHYKPGSPTITLFNVGSDGSKHYYTINVTRLTNGKFRWASRESLRKDRNTEKTTADINLAAKVLALEEQVVILTDVLRRVVNTLRDKKIIA